MARWAPAIAPLQAAPYLRRLRLRLGVALLGPRAVADPAPRAAAAVPVGSGGGVRGAGWVRCLPLAERIRRSRISCEEGQRSTFPVCQEGGIPVGQRPAKRTPSATSQYAWTIGTGVAITGI